MMQNLLDEVYYSRDLLTSYSKVYEGICLALLLSFAVIIICGRRNKGIRSYIVYLIGMVVFLLFPRLSDFVSSAYFGESLSENGFMIFPTLLVSLIGFIIIGRYFAKDISDKKKQKRMWIGFVVAMFAFVLVEASVPLQLTLSNFTLPSEKGVYSKEVKDISDIVGDESVIMPSKFKKAVTGYNWNANFPLDYNTDDYLNGVDGFFETGQNNDISYIVLQRTNVLGTKNEGDISKSALEYGYSLAGTVGEYLVYKRG